MRRRLLIGLAITVLLVVGVALFTLPMLQPPCQMWWHRVAHRADALVQERYGMTRGELQKEMGSNAIPLDHAAWEDAKADVGAQPFYCL